jgi:hypothetical protein
MQVLQASRKESAVELGEFYKKNPSDRIWWKRSADLIGEWLFSFNKIKVYNMFMDYPAKLTAEEKLIFDMENPFWKEFFSDRQ